MAAAGRARTRLVLSQPTRAIARLNAPNAKKPDFCGVRCGEPPQKHGFVAFRARVRWRCPSPAALKNPEPPRKVAPPRYTVKLHKPEPSPLRPSRPRRPRCGLRGSTGPAATAAAGRESKAALRCVVLRHSHYSGTFQPSRVEMNAAGRGALDCCKGSAACVRECAARRQQQNRRSRK